ncbi:MAG TPA: hypothetical protein VGX94_01845 [Terriglobia bacterium]|nr:hypothetical protein [Terriglobia bacterium]
MDVQRLSYLLRMRPFGLHVVSTARLLRVFDEAYQGRGLANPIHATRVTAATFLSNLANFWQSTATFSEERCRRAELESELESLIEKRERVLDSYFEGIISREERDRRLAAIQRDQELYQRLLLRARPTAELSADALARVFSPFFEWEYLGRHDKGFPPSQMETPMLSTTSLGRILVWNDSVQNRL